MILGYSTFMIQSSRLFSKNILEVDPPRVTHGKEPIYLSVWLILKQQLLLKHLYLLVTWGKKEGKYMIKKSTLFSIAKYFFWLCKWSVFRVHQNAFQREKWCFIISRCLAVSYEDTFLYTLCILEIYQFFPLLFLKIMLTLHIDSVR